MKLTVDLSALKNAVQMMGAEQADCELGFAFKDIDPDADIREGQELGKDIDLGGLEES